MKIIKRNGAEVTFDISKIEMPSPRPMKPWKKRFV